MYKYKVYNERGFKVIELTGKPPVVVTKPPEDYLDLDFYRTLDVMPREISISFKPVLDDNGCYGRYYTDPLKDYTMDEIEAARNFDLDRLEEIQSILDTTEPVE